MLIYLTYLTCSILVFTDAGFLDTLGKCSINDNDCLKNTYANAIKSIGSSGIPEYDIPPIDPVVLKDVSLNVVNFIDITLVEGTVKGITGCRFNKFSLNIKKERGFTEIACDLEVAGHYKINSVAPLIKSLLNGADIHGDGNGKVVLDNVVLIMDFPFYAQKRDGEIYIKCDYKSGRTDYKVLGKISFDADNLYLGEQEASKQIVDVLNQNWKFVLSSVGKSFVNKAMDFYYEYSSKLFDKVAAKNFITDDLTPYART